MKKNILISLQKACIAGAKEIQKDLNPESYSSDTRYLALKSYSDTIVAYTLLQDCIDSNPIIEEKNYGLDEDGSRLLIPKENILVFTESVNLELRSGFFTSSIVGIETAVRSLGRVIGLTDEHILRLVNNLLSKTKLNQEYINLFKIIFYSRNTMHNGGIVTDITNPISYKGKTYDLTQGALVLFDEDFEFMFTEFITFWSDLCKSEVFLSIPFIEHPYITEKNNGRI